ncbi:MAG: aspartate aminotransferase family protein, partial [Rhodospirillales bacterium]|nr:aspartate aminotransferase family protein [Rhodospirillales bacterium]
MEGQLATNLSLEQMDVETTLHAFTPIHEHEKSGPHIITSGDGIYVTDNKGDTYIDSMASLFCVNAGYGRKEIGEAIAEQARTFPYFHTMAGHANEQQIRL